METFFTLAVISPTESHCQPTGASLVYLVAQFSKLELVIKGCAKENRELALIVRSKVVFLIFFWNLKFFV